MAGKFMEALSDEGGASVSSMHPVLFAATFEDGRNSRVLRSLLNLLGGVKSIPVGSHGGLQPRRQCRPRSWETVEDPKVRMHSKYLLDLAINAPNGDKQGAQLIHNGFHHQDRSVHHSGILGQRDRRTNLPQSFINPMAVSRTVFLVELANVLRFCLLK